MTPGSALAGLDAEATARRALAWAAAAGPNGAGPASAAGPPPHGPLRDTGTLTRPSRGALTDLSDLIRDTGARLGAGRPPFGDPGAAGLGALFLAAGAGGRKELRAATGLIELIGPPSLTGPAPVAGAWLDALARHAVARPWLGVQDAPTEALLLASPLTEVLHRPAAVRIRTGTARQVAVAVAMLSRPRGAEVLRAAMAGWSADPAVLAWRTDFLRRLMHQGPAQQRIVADVYVTARLWHGEEWDRRVQQASRALGDRGSLSDLAIRTVAYWGPLAVLEGDNPRLVHERRALVGAQAAIEAARRHRLHQTVAM